MVGARAAGQSATYELSSESNAMRGQGKRAGGVIQEKSETGEEKRERSVCCPLA